MRHAQWGMEQPEGRAVDFSRCALVITGLSRPVCVGRFESSRRVSSALGHHVCDPVPELRIQFRNRGFETFQDDLSKPVAAFVAGLGFRRDLHMSAEPAEPPGGSLWLL